MAKNMKKVISVILTFCMLIGLTGATAMAEGATAKANTDPDSKSQIVEEGGKLYYLANGEEASADDYDVWTSKTIKETGIENEFEVTLQVGSTRKAEAEDVAVVLVMDASSSMLKNKTGMWSINSTGWNDYMPVEGPLMIDYAREAATEFVTGLVDNAGDASVKMAMVEFGNNAKTVFKWTEANKDGVVNEDIISSINRLDVCFTIDDDERDQCGWLDKIEEASFWAPVLDETGQCYYREDGVRCTDTDPDHKHNSKDAELCYWVKRQASFWDKSAGKCLYEGCTDTTANHKHYVEGCTYIHDNNPCTNTEPYHYHTFRLSDCDTINDTFGWNSKTSMYKQRYVLEDANGEKHLCVDFEILRQKSCGTNMEGGLLLANNLLDAGLAEGGAIEGYDNVYVIMLSDGQPTWFVSDTADRTSLDFVAGGKVSSSTNWSDLKNIVSNGEEGDLAYAEEIKEHAALYTVMYGYVGNDKLVSDAPASEEIPAGATVKSWLTGTGKNHVGIDELYMASDIESGLLEAFGNIGERIEVLSKAWTVTDALSDEVAFDGFTLNGEYAEYDDADHEIKWSVGDMQPEDPEAAGTVDDPYVYTLKYKVILDPDYAGVFEASEAGTGVLTNKGATLYYLVVDGDEDLKKLPFDELKKRLQEAPFDHPAVKAFYADHEFTKLSTATNEALEGAGFTVYKNDAAYTDEIFSDAEGKVKFEDLSAGSYQLVETTVPEGMVAMAPINFVVSYGELTMNGEAMPTELYNAPKVHDSAVTITIDMSGTMYRNKMGGSRYVDVAKAKAIDFVNKYAASATTESDVRMLAVAAFDTDAKVVLNWVDVNTESGLAAAKKAINGMRVVDNGNPSSNYVCTNFDGGVILTRNMMKQDVVEGVDLKYSIILSDGAPTVTVNADTNTVGTIKSSFWGKQLDGNGNIYQNARYGGGWTHPAEVANTLKYMGTGSDNLADLTAGYIDGSGNYKEGIFIVGVGGLMDFKLFNDAVYGTSNGTRSVDVKKKPTAFDKVEALSGLTSIDIMDMTTGEWMEILVDKVGGTYESAVNSEALEAEFDAILNNIMQPEKYLLNN